MAEWVGGCLLLKQYSLIVPEVVVRVDVADGQENHEFLLIM